MLSGADISSNQWRRGLPVRWRKAMLEAGLDFLFGRVSIGYQPDPSFPLTRKRSEGFFKMVGGYHYLVDSLDPLRQADTFMAGIHGTGGIGKLSTALDVEDDNRGPIFNHPSLQDVERWVRRFRDVHPNHPLGAYSNRSTWSRLGNPDVTSLGFDYAWHALYPGGVPPFPGRPPLAFGGEGRAELWQYGPLRLHIGNDHIAIDGDAFYGTEAELEALAGDVLLPPVTDRPRYAKGFNALVDAVAAFTKTVQVPDPGTGPAWETGVEDARQAALEDLDRLLIGE